jgi:LPS O-antigen subunit length determinant protein (WzzB/FepE family)
VYGNAIGSPYQNQQTLQPMALRPAPRLSDMPEPLLQELSADTNAQRVWESMSSEGQWRIIERHEKQVAQAREQEKIDAYDPNNDDAYSVSLSTAVDLWRAKHGDTWVRSFDTYSDADFYSLLENRLRNNDCFERMERYNRTWLRLKENI